jgi:GNAT superfamily N-acetyltransferase
MSSAGSHPAGRGATDTAGGPASPAGYAIALATPADVPDIHALIRALAEYERLAHLCVSSEADVAAALFGPHPAAQVLIARKEAKPSPAAGFALFFHNWSTFLGRPGLWLEDLFVRPEHRGAGLGRALLVRLAALARERGCGRFEWAVLDWNAPAIRFYQEAGAAVLPDWRICRVTGEALERLAGEVGEMGSG